MDTSHDADTSTARPPLLRVDSDPWGSYLAQRTPVHQTGLQRSQNSDFLAAISTGNLAAATALADASQALRSDPLLLIQAAVVDDEQISSSMLRMLLARGAQSNAADANGHTALHWAGMCGVFE
jgi:hypothetical protein